MNEKQTRPTKKQHELLDFIEQFIAEHGFSPSYREIMRGLDYTSVATVALHVNNLIARGHLVKRGHSARSLELAKETPELASQAHSKDWLLEKVEQQFKQAEAMAKVDPKTQANLEALAVTLRVLGLESEAEAFTVRLTKLPLVEDRPAI